MHPHEQSDGLWIGWSGAPGDLDPERQALLEKTDPKKAPKSHEARAKTFVKSRTLPLVETSTA